MNLSAAACSQLDLCRSQTTHWCIIRATWQPCVADHSTYHVLCMTALHVLYIGVETMCMQLQSEIQPPHWAATDQRFMQAFAFALISLTHNL